MLHAHALPDHKGKGKRVEYVLKVFDDMSDSFIWSDQVISDGSAIGFGLYGICWHYEKVSVCVVVCLFESMMAYACFNNVCGTVPLLHSTFTTKTILSFQHKISIRIFHMYFVSRSKNNLPATNKVIDCVTTLPFVDTSLCKHL